MTSATTTPARGMGGRHAEGYGLIVFASVLLLVAGFFNGIAGTATAVSNRVSRRQANRWARQEEEQYTQEP